jgi:shikimate kinase
MNNIYLVGFMGTGKSAVARELAQEHNLAWVDLDTLIEKRQGMSIADIFASRGESFFRGVESETLEDVAQTSGQVVSCGGGIVLDAGNVRLMKATGTVVCLSARPEVILQRTQGQRHRPLLNVDDPVARIAELLEQRAVAYALADHTIDTSDASIAEVARSVWQFLS